MKLKGIANDAMMGKAANVIVLVLIHLLVHTVSLAKALLRNGGLLRNVVKSAGFIRSPITTLASGNYEEQTERKSNAAFPHLNVIIPAYNEESRITATLYSYLSYLEDSKWTTYSIIVVDDGSRDATADVVRHVAESFPSVQCISLTRNCGKGVALAEGIAKVSTTTATMTLPQLILTADADGSADLASVNSLFRILQERLAPSNWDNPVLVCGYRTYTNEKAIGRRIFRWGFRTVVQLVCGDTQCRDSQCGFKLMTVAAAMPLYSALYLGRWSHDVEVLLRARMLGIHVAEAPVRWVDQSGSQLAKEGIVKVAVQMFADVVKCRLAYWLGIWTVKRHNSTATSQNFEQQN
jgi:dolichyl-phosphate beta-glucosyltransferase